ncbi:26141_t:CDS:2, partial [Racocetra persica]
NIELSTCTCFIGSSGVLCKHQGTVATRYNIGLLNFLHSLTPADHAHFAYIAHEITANDFSFYASLHMHANNQLEHHTHNDNKPLNSISQMNNQTQELEELNVDQITVSENNLDFFESFIEMVKHNYENGGSQLQHTFKNGTKIHVQVELVKRRKTNKENIDSQVIPARKIRTVDKKIHNLSQNIKKIIELK